MVDWQIDANRPRRVPRSSLTWVLEAAVDSIGSQNAHLGEAGEDEVPKRGEEQVEGRRRSRLVVEWQLVQVVFPSVVVITQLPRLNKSCSLNHI